MILGNGEGVVTLGAIFHKQNIELPYQQVICQTSFWLLMTLLDMGAGPNQVNNDFLPRGWKQTPEVDSIATVMNSKWRNR